VKKEHLGSREALFGLGGVRRAVKTLARLLLQKKKERAGSVTRCTQELYAGERAEETRGVS